MPELVEYNFRFPDFQPAPRALHRSMRLQLLRQKSSGTLHFEKQVNVGATFRGTRFYHLDRGPLQKFIGHRFFETCSSSTPTIFAEGSIGVDPSVHRSFETHRYIAPVALSILGDFFGEINWVDDVITNGEDQIRFPGVYITSDFFSIQAEPFERATGSLLTTLHKSAPRLPDEPSSRIFYRKFKDFYVGHI